MNITVDDLKGIAKSKHIDHQKLAVLALGIFCKT